MTRWMTVLACAYGLVLGCGSDEETTDSPDELGVASAGADDGGPGDGAGGPCADGVKGGPESDVDCGGPACLPCEAGQACNSEKDCASGLACTGGTCTGGDGPGPDTKVDCATYCAEVLEACGDRERTNQFYSEEECSAYCSALGWETGAATDTSGNTLGCRLNHATMAATESDEAKKLSLCEAAGPSGGGVCGEWCDVLCSGTTKTCTGQNAAYADEDDCRDECAKFPDSPNGTLGYAVANYFYYNTVQCRLRHLRSVIEHSASVHCPHTSAESTEDACDDASLPNCAHYCDMMEIYCEVPKSACSDPCMKAFATDESRGQHADVTGNTLGCRINQAEWSAPDEPGCKSAAIDGSTVCAD